MFWLNDRQREYLQERIWKRQDRLDKLEHQMAGAHYGNLAIRKNHLFQFEMDQLERANRYRPPESQIQVPRDDMYEAASLMRYVPEELRGVKVFNKSGLNG